MLIDAGNCSVKVLKINLKYAHLSTLVPLESHTNCVPLSGGDILISPGAFVWGQVVLKVEVPEFLKLIFPLL